jgi:hypothetical protein
MSEMKKTDGASRTAIAKASSIRSIFPSISWPDT